MDHRTNTSASTSWLGGDITVEDILHTAWLFKEYDRPTLFIWKGETSGPFYISVPLSEEPKLYYSKYIDDGMAYLVAGIGVVAGRKVYSKLEVLNLKLVWSDTFMDLDDQSLLFKSLGFC